VISQAFYLGLELLGFSQLNVSYLHCIAQIDKIIITFTVDLVIYNLFKRTIDKKYFKLKLFIANTNDKTISIHQLNLLENLRLGY